MQQTHDQGGCTCEFVRYRIKAKPFIVHCCHCRVCQRQTGAAFALNALFEANHVELTLGNVTEIEVPSPSGKGQTIARCPQCQVALWSNYFMGGLKDMIRFLRVGTLDHPDRMPPDVHIFTSTKQPWIHLPENDHAVEVFYEYETTWSKEGNARRQEMLASIHRNTP